MPLAIPSGPRALVGLVALALTVTVDGGCGFLLTLAGEPDGPHPPDSGAPVGGRHVADWHRDAALDPADVSSADAGDPLDGATPDAAMDGGALDASDLDASDLDASDLDAGDLDAGDLDGGDGDGNTSDAGAPPSDDAGSDAGADGGGPCGTVTMLADDFSAPPSDWRLEPNGAVDVSHSAGGVRFEVPAGSPPDAGDFGRLVSNWDVSLREDDLELVFSALPGSKRLVTTLSIPGPDPANDFLRLRYDGHAYRATVRSVTPSVDVTEVVTDPVAYRHWRVRHRVADNTIRFQVSSDGSSWTILWARAAPPWIDRVRPFVRVHGLEPANPQVVALDAVRGRVLSPSWCPAGELEQSFDDGLGSAWTIAAEEGCTASASSGELTFTQTPPGPLHCAARATSPRQLRGQTVVVKVRDRPSSALLDTFAGLHVLLGATHEAYLGIRAGTLRATVRAIDGSGSSSGTLDPPAPAGVTYLRLDVAADGSLDFSYATAEGPFMPLWEHAGGVPVDEAQILLTLATFGDASASAEDLATVSFEGVNAE